MAIKLSFISLTSDYSTATLNVKHLLNLHFDLVDEIHTLRQNEFKELLINPKLYYNSVKRERSKNIFEYIFREIKFQIKILIELGSHNSNIYYFHTGGSLLILTSFFLKFLS